MVTHTARRATELTGDDPDDIETPEPERDLEAVNENRKDTRPREPRRDRRAPDRAPVLRRQNSRQQQHP